ncbi:MAG: hypothetical protein WAL87_02620 [Chthoniobacterales bacterium]
MKDVQRPHGNSSGMTRGEFEGSFQMINGRKTPSDQHPVRHILLYLTQQCRMLGGRQ